MRVRVLDLAIPNSSFNHHTKKMPANKNVMPGPSTTKQMAMDLKAKLAVMEAEEEAVAAAAEAAQKAVASAKKVGKR